MTSRKLILADIDDVRAYARERAQRRAEVASIVFRFPGGAAVRSITEQQHAAQLTRKHITAAVHYIRFEFTPGQVADFTDGVRLCVDHPNYVEHVELLPATVAELLTDLDP